jgi:hypothetical protein
MIRKGYQNDAQMTPKESPTCIQYFIKGPNGEPKGRQKGEKVYKKCITKRKLIK